MDDLFGPRAVAWERFRTPLKPTRKYGGALRPAGRAPMRIGTESTVAPSTVPAEMAEKIRARRASEVYANAVDELNRWKGQMPQAEWDRLKAKVEGLK